MAAAEKRRQEVFHSTMKILFLHGWHSVPGGVKPTYLKDHGHEVINPQLDDDDFAAAVRTVNEPSGRTPHDDGLALTSSLFFHPV